MSEANGAVVRGMYEAFAQGDVPGVLVSFDPQIVWNEAENFVYADGNPYIGPDAIVEGVFMRLGSEWEYWTIDVEELLDAGDTVVALGRYEAKYNATGREIDAQFVHVWRLSDGKATRFQQYADTKQLAEAVAQD